MVGPRLFPQPISPQPKGILVCVSAVWISGLELDDWQAGRGVLQDVGDLVVVVVASTELGRVVVAVLQPDVHLGVGRVPAVEHLRLEREPI